MPGAALRVQAEQLTRVTEAERQESEKLKQSALADRSQLTDQIEKLPSENQRLQTSLTHAQAKLGEEHEGRVEDRKHSPKNWPRSASSSASGSTSTRRH